MENNKKSVFETLNAINVNDMVEKKKTEKSTLTYLSWSSAWQVVKEKFPDVEYEILRNPETNLPYWYDPLTGYMVFTKVTIGGQTHEMWLPVMDGTNHAMKAEPYEVQTKYKKFTVQAATMTDINKTIMRCLVKNLSIFGLGLYIYRGEDLPTDTEQAQPAQPAKPVEKAAPQAPAQPQATAQKPAQGRDTRPATKEMLGFIRKAIAERSITAEFICKSYKVAKLDDLRVYQAIHIKDNLSKLERMYLADIVEQSKQAQAEARTELTFGDAIAPPQSQQEKTEAEEVSLETLGLSPADLDALTECGNVFS